MFLRKTCQKFSGNTPNSGVVFTAATTSGARCEHSCLVTLREVGQRLGWEYFGYPKINCLLNNGEFYCIVTFMFLLLLVLNYFPFPLPFPLGPPPPPPWTIGFCTGLGGISYLSLINYSVNLVKNKKIKGK